MHFTRTFALAALPFLALTNALPYDDDTLSFLTERDADAQFTYEQALHARGLESHDIEIQTSSTGSGMTTTINGVVQPQVPPVNEVNSISSTTINGVTTTTINGVVQPPQGPAKKKRPMGKGMKKPGSAWTPPFDFGVQNNQVTNINTRDTSRLARALYARKLRERAMRRFV